MCICRTWLYEKNEINNIITIIIVNKHSQDLSSAIKSNISSSKGISFVLTFTNYYKRFLCFTKNLDSFFHCRWVCKTLWRSWRTTNWPLKKTLTVWLKPKDINPTNLFLTVEPCLTTILSICYFVIMATHYSGSRKSSRTVGHLLIQRTMPPYYYNHIFVPRLWLDWWGSTVVTFLTCR